MSNVRVYSDEYISAVKKKADPFVWEQAYGIGLVCHDQFPEITADEIAVDLCKANHWTLFYLGAMVKLSVFAKKEYVEMKEKVRNIE